MPARYIACLWAVSRSKSPGNPVLGGRADATVGDRLPLLVNSGDGDGMPNAKASGGNRCVLHESTGYRFSVPLRRPSVDAFMPASNMGE